MGHISNRSYFDDYNTSRVYCCLSKNSESILEEIVRDIFDCYKKDISISYRDDLTVGSKGKDCEISNAQLVVVIVSRTFLRSDENDLCRKEFQYAIDHYIPIIPIAISTGLEDEFNKKCGKFELVFKHDTKYYDVLKESLNRILTDEKIKTQIRSNFFGNIFLSYRRLDLNIAKEVMEFIHNVSDFDDIGIWYDGALTPGKDYEEEIFDNLDRCDVIVMVITARFLEKDNFIMKEYPKVKKSGMKILPYIAEDVDTGEIEKYYDGIFDDYNGGISDSQELINLLQGIFPVHKNNWNLEHYFFMGLARFYGVDFEYNIKKAIDYLVISAQGGYIPALKKLVDIYEYGIGVDTDITSAITYQEKIIKVIKDASAVDNKGQVKIFDEILRLADLQARTKNYDQVRNIYIDFVSESNNVPEKKRTVDFYLNLGIVYKRLGILERTLKNLPDGKKYFSEAETCIKQAESLSTDILEKENLSFVLSGVQEELVNLLMDFKGNGDIIMAREKMPDVIKPYEEKYFKIHEFSNMVNENLSRLIYLDCIVEIASYNFMYKYGFDESELVDQIEWIINRLKDALQYCIEPDYSPYIKNAESYYWTLKIYDGLKNAYHSKFCILPDMKIMDESTSALSQMMEILLHVNCDDLSKSFLDRLADECYQIGFEYVKYNNREKAREFFALAVRAVGKMGLLGHIEGINPDDFSEPFEKND